MSGDEILTCVEDSRQSVSIRISPGDDEIKDVGNRRACSNLGYFHSGRDIGQRAASTKGVELN